MVHVAGVIMAYTGVLSQSALECAQYIVGSYPGYKE